MEPGLIWILAGLLLLVAELVLPGVFLLWIGLAAIGTGAVLLLATPGFAAAVLVFLALLGGGHLARRSGAGRAGRRPTVNTPGSGLIGRTGTLLPGGRTGAAGAASATSTGRRGCRATSACRKGRCRCGWKAWTAPPSGAAGMTAAGPQRAGLKRVPCRAICPPWKTTGAGGPARPSWT